MTAEEFIAANTATSHDPTMFFFWTVVIIIILGVGSVLLVRMLFIGFVDLIVGTVSSAQRRRRLRDR